MSSRLTDRLGALSPPALPDPSFYPSPRAAASAPPETLAYVAVVNPTPEDGRPDALRVVDVDATSATFGLDVGGVALPNAGDELHHFGWNACSSALCPAAPHPHVERRYLVVPGLRSSRIHVIDTKGGGGGGRRARSSCASSSPRSCTRRPGTRGRTPSTAGRTGST